MALSGSCSYLQISFNAEATTATASWGELLSAKERHAYVELPHFDLQRRHYRKAHDYGLPLSRFEGQGLVGLTLADHYYSARVIHSTVTVLKFQAICASSGPAASFNLHACRF